MTTLGAVEAKAHFSDLLERASKGEDFVITRRGVPIVRVVPYAQKTKAEITELIEELKDFRSNIDPVLEDGETWNELSREGSKW